MSSPDSIEPPPWGTAAPIGPADAWGPPDLAGGRPDFTDTSAPPEDPVAESYASGYEAGFGDGRSQAMTELEPVRAALRGVIASLERDQLAARQAAAENIYGLAIVVAQWLFQREVEADVGLMESLLRRALSLLPAGTPIEVRVNPVDLAALGDHLELKEPDGRRLSVHWVADQGIDRGSFTLASPERLVDGRADVALRSLYERLVAG